MLCVLDRLRPSRVLAPFVIALVATLFAGCSWNGTESPQPSASASATATASPSAAPEFDEDGDAAANQAFFDSLLAPLDSGDGLPSSDDVLNALRDGGFGDATMQITPNVTPTGLDADSKMVSVLWEGECLIGQYRDGYRSVVADPVNGVCLVGETEPID